MYEDFDYRPLGAMAATSPEAVEEIGVVACSECGEPFDSDSGYVYYDGDHSYYCEICACSVAARYAEEAEAYAEEHCKITGPLPEYDPDEEYKCSPEEYEQGLKDSYSPNAYLALCRHRYSNYEALIKPLDKASRTAKGRLAYQAIRKRIMDLLLEAIGQTEWAGSFLSY